MGHVRTVKSNGHWSALLAFGVSTVGICLPPCLVPGLCPWALSRMDCDTGVLGAIGVGITKALRTHSQPHARKFLLGFSWISCVRAKGL